MAIFQLLISKIFPMYLLIGLGFVAGRTKKISAETVAVLLIYFLIPVVIFFGVLSTPLTTSRILVPLFTFAFCTSIAFLFRVTSKKYLNADHWGIWSYAAGSGNSGYFGIPLAYGMLGSEYVGLLILAALGFLLYENTFGFFFVARAHSNFKQSLKKLAELPTIWAFLLAIAAQKSGIHMTASTTEIYHSFRSTYSVLGMMLLGLGIAHIKTLKIQWKILLRTFSFKFLVWPGLMLSFLIANKNSFHFFDSQMAQCLFLISIVPLPANAVAFSAALKTDPEHTALLVFFSTLFALFFIPAVWGLNLLFVVGP